MHVRDEIGRQITETPIIETAKSAKTNSVSPLVSSKTKETSPINKTRANEEMKKITTPSLMQILAAPIDKEIANFRSMELKQKLHQNFLDLVKGNIEDTNNLRESLEQTKAQDKKATEAEGNFRTASKYLSESDCESDEPLPIAVTKADDNSLLPSAKKAFDLSEDEVETEDLDLSFEVFEGDRCFEIEGGLDLQSIVGISLVP